MPNSESVGKKIVEALKKQAENIEENTNIKFEDEPITPVEEKKEDIFMSTNDDIFAEPESTVKPANFFDDVEENNESFFMEQKTVQPQQPENQEGFEMPANIAVLRRLISQLPSGVSRHTGAQIIKQTMEALGISWWR